MGCQTSIDHHKRIEFMEHYNRLQKDFIAQTPLFEVQCIEFPLHTEKMKIVDKSGRRVKISGVNWSGSHAQRHCVSGLQFRNLDQICLQLKQKMGFNCIRLTFSLQMYYDNNIIPSHLLSANPQLHGKTAMEIFDLTIDKLTTNGLMVILNNHTSRSMWCCTPWDGDGLWYTKDYSQQKYFQCMVKMAQRYKHYSRVIGMDLRNQVRSNFNLKPTWGSGNKLTDWKIAAEKVANLVHSVAPHWLIFIGSINSQLDFTDIYHHPLKLNIPNKLVYTGHFYSFSWLTTIWTFMSYETFKQKLFNLQLYVRGLDNGIPFLLGEFGSNRKDTPWNYLMRLMKEYDLDWTYWCLDGYKCKDKQDETYGIYQYKFDQIRHKDLFEDLKFIGNPKNNNKPILKGQDKILNNN